MVVRWTFTDPSTSETHTLDINPSEENSPEYNKNIQYVNTSAPDGKVLMFEGRDQPRRGSFSGVIRSESELNTLQSWWDKRNQIQITDDLGRQRTVIFESFKPKRVRALQAPWKHEYEMSFIIVDW